MPGIGITAQANILQTHILETAERSIHHQKFQGHKISDCAPTEMI